MRFPDLARVGEILEQTNGAAYNRLDPLFTLGLFRESYSNSSFATMVNLSAAIDFSQIPSDALKNALAELVVSRRLVFQLAATLRNSPTSNCR